MIFDYILCFISCYLISLLLSIGFMGVCLFIGKPYDEDKDNAYYLLYDINYYFDDIYTIISIFILFFGFQIMYFNEWGLILKFSLIPLSLYVGTMLFKLCCTRNKNNKIKKCEISGKNNFKLADIFMIFLKDSLGAYLYMVFAISLYVFLCSFVPFDGFLKIPAYVYVIILVIIALSLMLNYDFGVFLNIFFFFCLVFISLISLMFLNNVVREIISALFIIGISLVLINVNTSIVYNYECWKENNKEKEKREQL